MKRIVVVIALLLSAAAVYGQDKVWTEASDLTLIGKLFPDTPNPYHRIDTVKYKGFTNRRVLRDGFTVHIREDQLCPRRQQWQNHGRIVQGLRPLY